MVLVGVESEPFLCHLGPIFARLYHPVFLHIIIPSLFWFVKRVRISTGYGRFGHSEESAVMQHLVPVLDRRVTVSNDLEYCITTLSCLSRGEDL